MPSELSLGRYLRCAFNCGQLKSQKRVTRSSSNASRSNQLRVQLAAVNFCDPVKSCV